MIRKFLMTAAKFLLNPRFLLCFGIGWIITNGWSYILFALGTVLDSGWMIAVASAYLAFLWLPVSPEKIVTVAIAMFLLKALFPNDQKTLGILRQLHQKIKAAARLRRTGRKPGKKLAASLLKPTPQIME